MFKTKTISQTQKENIPKAFSPTQWLIIILMLLAFGGITTSFYYFNKYKNLKSNPNLDAQKETKVLLASLGKLIELPNNETPTIATVIDKDKLKDQPFFAKAENGDKLLAYTKSMKAILYRPSTNKIINVAPIVINQEKEINKNKPTSKNKSNPKIAYYNGTESPRLSDQTEKIIKKAYPDFETAALTNASKKDYKETLIIDLKGSFSEEATAIADLLKGKISSLPEGETKPDADILVILGK